MKIPGYCALASFGLALLAGRFSSAESPTHVIEMRRSQDPRFVQISFGGPLRHGGDLAKRVYDFLEVEPVAGSKSSPELSVSLKFGESIACKEERSTIVSLPSYFCLLGVHGTGRVSRVDREESTGILKEPALKASVQVIETSESSEKLPIYISQGRVATRLFYLLHFGIVDRDLRGLKSLPAQADRGDLLCRNMGVFPEAEANDDKLRADCAFEITPQGSIRKRQ